jgi:hypothetical protein
VFSSYDENGIEEIRISARREPRYDSVQNFARGKALYSLDLTKWECQVPTAKRFKKEEHNCKLYNNLL